MMLLTAEREKVSYQIKDQELFKKQALTWAAGFEVCCVLDSNSPKTDAFNSYDMLLGIGNEAQLFDNNECSFEALKAFYELQKDWLFGFLTYDLKNDIENLSSSNADQLEFPGIHFFQPSIVIEMESNQVRIHTLGRSPDAVFREISTVRIPEYSGLSIKPRVLPRISKEQYLKTIERIKEHIIEGDIYEMNFCQEFYIENIQLSPLDIYAKLNEVAKAPFSAFYRLKNKYLLCASPERYLKKEGNTLISQPIKGTIRRGENEEEDRQLREQLYRSEKDRAENVMIVDLVRNDLARVCEAGSVKVEELFGIYPFEQVFQMISTVKGQLKQEKHFIEAIKQSFPMGSMTGAPKVMAMQLIEKYEQSKRGLYSGAVGYIKPDGDFDFNVVIRSILYNASKAYLSFQVGGAIVYDSNAEDEYAECLLKAKAILKTLSAD